MNRGDVHVHAREAGWAGILRSLGVPEELLDEKHHPCPHCGGTDRFRIIDLKEARWVCNQCRPETGSGFDLLMLLNNWSFKEAANNVRKTIGVVQPLSDYRLEREKQRKKEEWNARRERLARVWRSGEPLLSTPAWEYLVNRGVNQGGVQDLRFTMTTGEGVMTPSPCMIAAIRNARGSIVSIHRTFLEDMSWMGWRKADIPSPKQIMPALGTINGGAVRLKKLTGSTLGIAEGIETALSASILNDDLPVWAVLSTNGIRSFEIPKGVERLIVFADRDGNGAGQKAAYELALKHPVITEVRLPEGFGDFNDYLE